MPSERIQRQINRLLDEAEEAFAARDWTQLRDQASDVLKLDSANEEAAIFLAAAENGLSDGESTAADVPDDHPAPIAPPSLPDAFVEGRYQVKDFLGEGGRKRVYLAHDTRLDRDVAFAVIKTEGLDANGRQRLKREAEAMGRLSGHPHIVTIYDTGEEDGQPYIVSEYMAGGDVESLITEADGHQLDLALAVAITGQVAHALEHAHADGVIHRDLKPGNIWLTEDGTAKLGDFGLAFAASENRMTTEGTMLGTVAYMPPEQALGNAATPQSDLYSLGCALYEMVVGRPPFVGDDAVAVISQHLNTAPVAPSWNREDCPSSLDGLIESLLAKSVEDRPASAAAVRSELSGVDLSTPAAATEHQNPLDRLARGVFVGREAELQQVRAALDQAILGSGGVVLLVGEPGIGKTQLALELETYAKMRGAQVLWGRAHEDAGAPPYWPWIQAVRSYVASADPGSLRRHLGSGASEVARVVSEIRTALPDLPPQGPPPADEAAQFRLFDSITSFLQHVAEAQPLMIVLDDLHWADRSTLRLLTHIAFDIERCPILLVATYRDVEVGRHHPLEEVLAQLARVPRTHTIDLKGLGEEAIASLMRESTGITPAAEAVTGIARETNGNPFFVTEIVSLLAQEGALTHGRVPIPPSVRSVLGHRLSSLSEGCNELLAIAAVIGREFTQELLCLIGSADQAGILEWLDEAEQTRLIARTSRSGEYHFVHALIRETLLQEVPTSQRVRLHGEVALAIETAAVHPEEQATALAYHFGEAATLGLASVEKAVRYGLQAAEHSEDRVAWDEAVRQYRNVLAVWDLAAEPGDVVPVLVALGEAQRRAGLLRESMETFQRLAEVGRNTSQPEVLARAAVGFEDAYMASGLVRQPERDPSVRLCEEALGAVEGSGTALEARVMAAFGQAKRFGADVRAADALTSRAVDLARSIEDDAALGYALYARCVAERGTVGSGTIGDTALELVEVARRQGDRDLELAGLEMRASDSMQDPADLDLREQLTQYSALAQELRQPAGMYNARFWSASLLALRGKWEEAERALDESLRFGARADSRKAIIQVPSVRRVIAFLTGDAEREDALIRDYEALDAEFGSTFPHVQLHPALIAARRGEPADAQVALDQLTESLLEEHWNILGSYILAIWLDLAAAVGDPKACALLAAWSATYREQSNAVFPPASIAGHRALVLRSLGRLDEAIVDATHSLERSRRANLPAMLAVDLIELGTTLVERGRRDDRERALKLVSEGLTIAQRLGMRPFVDRGLRLRVALQGALAANVRSSIETVAASIEAERPDLSPQAAPDGTVTLLFSDIENSTARTAELGDAKWMELLHEHNAIIRDQLAVHSGFEVKSMGDGFMLAFRSAFHGLRCAIGMQQAFWQRNAHADEPIRVRIGLHTGEAIREADDFFGTQVNLAARIGGAAEGNEILVSGLLKALTESAGEFEFDEGREVELKGISGAQRVHAVTWR